MLHDLLLREHAVWRSVTVAIAFVQVPTALVFAMGTEHNHYKYKIILLGAVGVGKTSIFNRLKTGKFLPDTTEQTHGTDIYNYSMTVGDDRIKVSMHKQAHVFPRSCMAMRAVIGPCSISVITGGKKSGACDQGCGLHYSLYSKHRWVCI